MTIQNGLKEAKDYITKAQLLIDEIENELDYQEKYVDDCKRGLRLLDNDFIKAEAIRDFCKHLSLIINNA